MKWRITSFWTTFLPKVTKNLHRIHISSWSCYRNQNVRGKIIRPRPWKNPNKGSAWQFWARWHWVCLLPGIVILRNQRAPLDSSVYRCGKTSVRVHKDEALETTCTSTVVPMCYRWGAQAIGGWTRFFCLNHWIILENSQLLKPGVTVTAGCWYLTLRSSLKGDNVIFGTDLIINSFQAHLAFYQS